MVEWNVGMRMLGQGRDMVVEVYEEVKDTAKQEGSEHLPIIVHEFTISRFTIQYHTSGSSYTHQSLFAPQENSI